jgi:hypothetical protein
MGSCQCGTVLAAYGDELGCGHSIRSHLGLSGHQAPEELAYTFTYLSVFAGSLLVFFGPPSNGFRLYGDIDGDLEAGITSPISFGTT